MSDLTVMLWEMSEWQMCSRASYCLLFSELEIGKCDSQLDSLEGFVLSAGFSCLASLPLSALLMRNSHCASSQEQLITTSLALCF